MLRQAREYFYTAKQFAEKHRRHIPTAALFAGFIWDVLTLGRPDQLFDNLVILFYLVLAGVMIILLNRKDERGERPKLSQLVLLQFCFGNLASALFIIFGKSGTIVGSWPFLLVFLALLISNEFLRGRYNQLRFHIAIYYLFLLAYSVLLIPVLVRAVGPEVFFVSGIFSFVLISIFLTLVYFAAPKRTAENKQYIFGIIISVFIGFNIFYAAGLIPPVPLSLKDIGIYHNIERNADGTYDVAFERGRWYQFWKRSDSTFHYFEGDRAFCFSSVFAPARISTPIKHRWEYYDTDLKNWETSSEISFPISGGRTEGFRGYSEKSVLFPGRWRCSVETARGELIGRKHFEVVEGGEPVELEVRTR